MKSILTIALYSVLATYSNTAKCQQINNAETSMIPIGESEKDPAYKKYFVGSSLFMLGNLATRNKPDFVQLNFGYRITTKDVVSIELITWKYAWPLGIPYGKSFEAQEEKYPGYVREVGVALAYQRFLWKGAYAAAHAFNARQTYFDEDNKKIQNGYQLFMTYRIGYHIQLFKNSFFIERLPSFC